MSDKVEGSERLPVKLRVKANQVESAYINTANGHSEPDRATDGQIACQKDPESIPISKIHNTAPKKSPRIGKQFQAGLPECLGIAPEHRRPNSAGEHLATVGYDRLPVTTPTTSGARHFPLDWLCACQGSNQGACINGF